MHPELFHITIFGREYIVLSYSFFLMLTAITLLIGGSICSKKQGLEPGKSTLYILFGLLSLIMSARLMHWLTSPSSFEHGITDLFSLTRTNLSGYAGLLITIPTMALALSRKHISTWKLADSITPALALAACLAKLGCLLNGCCYGVPTNLPWAIQLTTDQQNLSQVISGNIGLFDSPLPVHPIQGYEALAALTGGVLAMFILRRHAPNGVTFLAFMIWFSAWRWITYPLLQSSALNSYPPWLYPTFYSFVIIGSCLAIAVKYYYQRKNQEIN